MHELTLNLLRYENYAELRNLKYIEMSQLDQLFIPCWVTGLKLIRLCRILLSKIACIGRSSHLPWLEVPDLEFLGPIANVNFSEVMPPCFPISLIVVSLD